VPDDRLDALFEGAAHVILPYEQYRYVLPMSGSAIHALRRGRIVWASPANAIPEIIRDGENGFFLTKDLEQDVRRLADVLDNQAVVRRVSAAARRSALEMAHYDYRSRFRGSG
jgi:glycosyltransferase involved in cell wall biosynthesis